mmetsp:Transcript_9801/g.21928  ORF Transcript_9801/g.21928 Transcript_9801/m.21928 type:complete len:252 (-) Transcript_9801:387-1142(-)
MELREWDPACGAEVHAHELALHFHAACLPETSESLHQASRHVSPVLRGEALLHGVPVCLRCALVAFVNQCLDQTLQVTFQSLPVLKVAIAAGRVLFHPADNIGIFGEHPIHKEVFNETLKPLLSQVRRRVELLGDHLERLSHGVLNEAIKHHCHGHSIIDGVARRGISKDPVCIFWCEVGEKRDLVGAVPRRPSQAPHRDAMLLHEVAVNDIGQGAALHAPRAVLGEGIPGGEHGLLDPLDVLVVHPVAHA